MHGGFPGGCQSAETLGQQCFRVRPRCLPACMPTAAHCCCSLPLQRVFEHLFARMSEGGGGNKFLVECSFLEIYNEVRRAFVLR